MNKIFIKDFYYSLSNKRNNLPLELNDPQIIAEQLYRISQDSPYSPSLLSVQKFCVESFSVSENDVYHLVILAQFQYKIIGFMIVKIVQSDADIEFICVDKEFRSLGIGSRLIDYLEKILVNNLDSMVDRVFLEVSTENKEGIALYDKYSFKVIGERRKYYKNGENAFVMEKSISKNKHKIRSPSRQ